MAMTPSDDPIKSASQGITEGFLNCTIEQVKIYAQKFRDRDLAFIEDQETIALVKEQRRSSEWELFKNYVIDKDLRLLAQMGLTLRKLNEKGNRQGLQHLRDKIFSRYGNPGLHTAEFVQEQLLSTVIARTVPTTSSVDMKIIVQGLLRDVDKYTVFVQAKDDVEKLVRQLTNRLDANLLQILLLFGKGAANGIMVSVAKGLKDQMGDEYMLIKEESNEAAVMIFQRHERKRSE